MKSMMRQMCCILLIASLLFQTAPMVQAQSGQARGPIAGVNAELLEARRILSEDSGAKTSQDAVSPLDRAKRLAGDPAFAKAFPGSTRDFLRDLEKARLKVLWNDQDEALSIVNRLLGMIDGKGQATVPQTPCGNGPGAGTAFGAALVAGLGAVLVGLFFGYGQVSHR